MTPRDPLVDLILDDLYGLLDPDDQRRLAERLANQQNADALRAEAERLRGLLAQAARTSFPGVTFAAPKPTPAVPRWRTKRALGTAIAAGVLLAVGVPGVVGGWRYANLAADAQQARAVANREQQALAALLQSRSAKVAAADRTVTAARTEVERATTQIATEEQQARDGVKAKQLVVAVSGPATLQAGAPTEYRIETRDGRNVATPSTLTARVKDAAGQVVYEQIGLASNGSLALTLPADLPLRPGRDLNLEVLAQREEGAKTTVRETLPLALPLYYAHVATDKPLYQPGETVYFRALALDRFRLQPPSDDFRLQFRVLDPRGQELFGLDGLNRVRRDGETEVVNGPDGKPLRGVGCGAWGIPAEAAGGEYTLAVREASGRFPEEKRKFLVRAYRPDRINKELEFHRKSYGPGDTVQAHCKASRAEGGAVAKQPVRATAIVDGQAVPAQASHTDGDGRVTVSLQLPAKLDRGEGSVSVTFTDGGSVETLVRPIPIALKKLFIDFYPEGGDLVAGVPNRVYLAARTNTGKPADLRGRIVDAASGAPAGDVATLNDDREPGINQGMARGAFTPQAGRSYKLLIDSPAGVEGDYPLPAIKAEGVILDAGTGVSADPAPLRVTLHSSGGERDLLVGAYCRGRVLDHRRVRVEPGRPEAVDLTPPAGVGGVTRVTVFEEIGVGEARKALRPVAERLVYRVPAGAVKLDAQPNKPRFVPGERVRLNLKATTETGSPAPSVAYAAVVNQSVVTMADEKTFRAMPTHFLLTSEVRRAEELEHADVLLGSHPKAHAALDLLLGTQGWRRFAEQKPGDFKEELGQEAERLLVSIGRGTPRQVDSFTLEAEKVQERLLPALLAARERLAATERAVSGVQIELADVNEVRKLSVISTLADAEQARAEQALNGYVGRWRDRLSWLAQAGVGFAVLMAVGGLMYGAVTRSVSPVWIVLGCFGMLLGGGVAAVLMIGQRADATFSMVGAELPMPTSDARVEEKSEAGSMSRSIPDREGRLSRPAGMKDAMRDAPKFEPPPVTPPAEPLAPPPPTSAMPAIAGRSDPKPSDVVTTPTPTNRGEGDAGDRAKSAEKKVLRGVVGGRPAATSPSGRPAAVRTLSPAVGGRANAARQNRESARDELEAEVAAIKPVPSEPPVPVACVVREYAHRHAASANGHREDFVETLLWQPALVMADGTAQLAFDLADSVTRYQVLVSAHTLDGRLGATRLEIEARKPLTVEPKLPAEIGSSDRLLLPVTVGNGTDGALDLQLRATAFGGDFAQPSGTVRLAADGRGRQTFALTPTRPDGQIDLQFDATDGRGLRDRVAAKLAVVPDGFPVVGRVSGTASGSVEHNLLLPETWLPGTLKCEVTVLPSPLADMQRGLDALLREPHGCFEQTSSSNYPNLLILQYLQETGQSDPALVARCRDLLDRGTNRLMSFEVPQNSGREGFEWFGRAPAHEALTAYGLLQFRDLASVYPVDAAMVKRTNGFLLNRRDGQGGFLRDGSFHSFGAASRPVVNAYIVWALSESGGREDIDRELDAAAKSAATTADPYLRALVANALLNRQRDAATLLDQLVAAQAADGLLIGTTTSVTSSRDRDLAIETTALAALAWMKAPDPVTYREPLRKALAWIGQQRGGYGGYGGTQATVLALRSLVQAAKANKRQPVDGSVAVTVGGKELPGVIVPAQATGTVTVTLDAADLKPGVTPIRVAVAGPNPLPYTLAWSYHTLTPPSDAGCPVTLSTKLDRAAMNEGDTVRLTASVRNASGQGQGMAVAIVGLPAGLKVPEDMKQLKELARPRGDGTEPGAVDFFEVRGRELVLYWRDMAPNAVKEVGIDLIAALPGTSRGPASRAYLYYGGDTKHWVPPLEVAVTPK